VDCREADFRDTRLSGAKFSGAQIGGADFADAEAIPADVVSLLRDDARSSGRSCRTQTPGTPMTPMTPRVFLCEPSVLTSEQRKVCDTWHERLFERGFDVQQVRRDAYDPDPGRSLPSLFAVADGVLALGFDLDNALSSQGTGGRTLRKQCGSSQRGRPRGCIQRRVSPRGWSARPCRT
jgi:uncharacterized protein YjbI with pentapeptide repeats